MSQHALPPRRALRILQWFVRGEYLEEIEGDMEEIFQNLLEEMPEKAARRKYNWEVVRLFRPALVKHVSELLSKTHGIMIRNNLKIAWRSMAKQKGYTAIKLGSFALGVAACLLVALYLQHELRYDRQIPDHERIYRAAFHFQLPDMEGVSAFHSAPFAARAQEDFPEIEQVGRVNISTIHGAGGNNLKAEGMEVSLYEERVVYADPEILQLFQPRVIEGNIRKALAAPNTLVLTESRARKYFPRGNALGGVIYLNGNKEQPWTVSAVVEDVPSHSHLQYDVLLTQVERELWPGEQDAWDSNNYHTYLKLAEGTDPDVFVQKLNRLIDEYMIPTWKQAGYVAEDFPNEAIRYQLMPVADIHLHASGIQDAMVHSDVRRVRVFGFIAVFILLLACVNFVNLATARSANRAKEVGLRKTLGSVRRQLIGQFLTESVLLSTLGVVLGVIIASLALPFFNVTTGRQLVFHWWADGWWLVCLGTALVLGVLSGLYPAMYLSTFRPIQVLKGNLTTGVRRAGLRNGLVGFQFVTAMVLIFGTVVINRQMSFIHNTDLGFNKDQVLMIQGVTPMGESVYVFQEELAKTPGIQSVSVTDYLPIRHQEIKRNGNFFYHVGVQDEEGAQSQFWQVDENYLETFGLKLVEGKDFSAPYTANANQAIINEALVKNLQLENPIGEVITNGRDTLEVIGVVANFHYNSLKEEVHGVCLVVNPRTWDRSSMVVAKANTDNLPLVLADVETLWREYAPQEPLRYSFMDEEFDAMYEEVEQTQGLVSSLSLLAILIACMGLLGLSAYIAEQRAKEMTIRKVLGATVAGIFQRLTWNYLKIMLISAMLAFPLGWWLMKQWLADFEYSIPLSWWIYGLAALLTAAIILITVSRQALSVALANPSQTLRSE